MIHILFFIERFANNGAIGGAEKVLFNLVNHMDKGKFDITVQTLFPETLADRLDPKVRYRYCYPKKNKFYQLLYRAEAQLGLTYSFHIRDKYDIEIAYLECGPTKIIASSTNKKAKKIAWVHCDFAVAFGQAFVEKTRKYYQKFNQIVCVSEQCKKSFDRLFGDGFNTTVLHNVIDENEILQKSGEFLPELPQKTKLTLLNVGRLTSPKNPFRLFKVHKRLLEAGIDHELWWVGDGELRSEAEAEIDALGIADTVKLLGFQSNPYPFIRTADLLVCSSNYEGYSTFITEGLILGKPIVTTDCSGMHELLGESEYGIITENDDEDLYRKLYDLLRQGDAELKSLSSKSRQRGKEFETHSIVTETEAFFMKS